LLSCIQGSSLRAVIIFYIGKDAFIVKKYYILSSAGVLLLAGCGNDNAGENETDNTGVEEETAANNEEETEEGSEPEQDEEAVEVSGRSVERPLKEWTAPTGKFPWIPW
jgi:hypothetical protein